MNNRFKILLPLIIGVSIFAGFMLNSYFSNSRMNSAFLQNKPTDKLTELFDLIENEYADSVSKDAIIESLIPIVLEKLDPHSSYIVPEEYNEVNDPIMGSFEGIGVQFNIKNDTIVIVQVISGGPSERVKLRAGDRIVKINDSIVAGKKITDTKVVKLLKGPKGTKVKVGVLRKGSKKLIDFVITRDKIPFNSIDASYMIDSNTGYIKISRFAVTTPDEFMKAMEALKNAGLQKVIIDLRENGGGVLNSAIFLANEFLNKGDLIVYTKGKSHDRQDFLADGKGTCKNIKLAVLINEFSASASEVFAGAIQDNDRGIIVGRRSFGKGFVNRDFMFADSSMVRLTVQKFYSPSGRCIQKPYKNGNKEYENELAERYHHGEFSHVDSINFPDSLKFKTKKGKTVYGGGGIMPEFFVPMDTLGYSDYFSIIVNTGILYDFAFDYSDKNRETLKKFTNSKDCLTYLESKQLIPQLVNYATAKGVKPNSKQLQISKRLIETQLYAYIIRNILGEKAFTQVENRDDTTIKMALSKLK
jgi:carboxyl-terminal processing protease